MNTSNTAEVKMRRQWRITVGLDEMLVISDLGKNFWMW